MREESRQARPAEESIPEGLRAAESRVAAGGSGDLDSAGDAGTEAPAEGVLTQVCFTCGREYHFDAEPPEELTCGKCGGTVFRSFFSPDPSDEAAQDFADSTARDLDPDDPATDTMPGDVIDLNRS